MTREDDAISKQAVLDAISRIGLFKSDTREVQAVAECLRAVEALPSVKPQEPKTGYWKRIGYDIYECSICGQNVMTGDICAYRHCHGCGANMESEDKRLK